MPDLPLPPWFARFCDPAADRLSVLVQTLHDASIPFEVVRTGRFRHVQVRSQRSAAPSPGEKVLVAHYDRVLGTPGANDNGASVLALVDYLARPRNGAALRVVFTDGEELSPGAPAADQGSYALGCHWVGAPWVPIVLDMTGIGDTVVLGHLGEHLRQQGRELRGSVPSHLHPSGHLRVWAKRFLATCGAGDTLEVNAPFSDDLGFFLAGIPAVQISLLPRKEALAYRGVRASPGELSGHDPGAFPPSWRAMHGPDDSPDTLWPGSRILMAQILDRLEVYPLAVGEGV